MKKQIQVALFNNGHEVSYYYYKREYYPAEIGAWDLKNGDTSHSSMYSSRATYVSRFPVVFLLGKNAMLPDDERDDIYHQVTGFALFTEERLSWPFYYIGLADPIQVTRDVTVALDLHVHLAVYWDSVKHMGKTDWSLRHELLGFEEPYEHAVTMAKMRGGVAKQLMQLQQKATKLA